MSIGPDINNYFQWDLQQRMFQTCEGILRDILKNLHVGLAGRYGEASAAAMNGVPQGGKLVGFFFSEMLDSIKGHRAPAPRLVQHGSMAAEMDRAVVARAEPFSNSDRKPFETSARPISIAIQFADNQL